MPPSEPVDQRQFNRRGATIDLDWVLGPGGYRHKSLVRKIKKGFFLRRRKGELQLVDRRTQRIHKRELLADPGAMHPQIGSGWLAYAEWRRPDDNPIKRIYTNWTVPAAPSTGENGQTIFLFNGLQNDAKNEIIQPVLQWGSSALGGGGGSWWISNWHVGPTGLLDGVRPMTRVNVNDSLTGSVTMFLGPQGTFTYVSQFLNHPEVDLRVSGSEEFTWVCQTLEAYGYHSDADFPVDDYTAMTGVEVDLTVTGINPIGWAPRIPTPPAPSVQVSDYSNPGGEVIIFYR